MVCRVHIVFPLMRMCSYLRHPYPHTQGLLNTSTSTFFPTTKRQLHLSYVNNVKQIVHTEEEGGKRVVIEGRHIPSPRSDRLIPQQIKGTTNTQKELTTVTSPTPCPCPLCRLGLYIQHTDVLILSQFVDSRGQQIPKEVTGLCKLQYRRLDYLLVMAEKAGLMEMASKDGTKRELMGWEALNKYYDDALIEEFLYYKTKRNRA